MQLERNIRNFFDNYRKVNQINTYLESGRADTLFSNEGIVVLLFIMYISVLSFIEIFFQRKLKFPIYK